MVRYVKTRRLSLECCREKELRKFPALKSMFLSRVQEGFADNGRFSGDNSQYLNQFSMSSTVKNIESSSSSFVFFLTCRIELSGLKTVQNQKNIVRTSKHILLTLNYKQFLKVFRMLAPFNKTTYEFGDNIQFYIKANHFVCVCLLI